MKWEGERDESTGERLEGENGWKVQAITCQGQRFAAKFYLRNYVGGGGEGSREFRRVSWDIRRIPYTPPP